MSREVKRVSVGFDWPLRKVWRGYVLTDEEHERWAEDDCPDCARGYAPRAQYLHDLWYGKVPFRPEDNGSTPLTSDTPAVREFAERNVTRDENSLRFYVGGSRDVGLIEQAIMLEAHRLAEMWNGQWCHHLNRADVDALIAAGRLVDFTHRVEEGKGWVAIEPRPVVTPEMVNEWNIRSFGHDSLNAMISVRARCEREGVSEACPTCGGHASLERFPGQRAEAEAWERTEPPVGEGWQLWESVTEGSPVSPVFATADELAQWLTTGEGARAAGTKYQPVVMNFEQARRFVDAGWAPTGVDVGRDYENGVEFVATRET